MRLRSRLLPVHASGRALRLGVLLGVAACSGPAQAGESDIAARIAGGLRQRVDIAGEPAQTFDIEQRLRRYNVSSVSLAVIRDSKIVWAGVYRQPSARAADTDTLYQAASISKGVTGALAQRLARTNELALDVPVDACLRPWVLPAGQ